MKRLILFCLGFVLFIAIITVLYLFIFREFSHQPADAGKDLVKFDANGSLTAFIPKDSIVVDCSKPTSITPPLAIVADPKNKTEKILALPEGKGTEGAKNNGLATYKVEIQNPGKYKCWARVRWDDSCSNSMVFQIGKQREKLFGQDAIYNSWHWVPIGEFEIPQGEQIIALKEREDGIAVDQLLLCPNAGYHPQGRIVAGKDLKESRQFADSFYRSEGHGLKHWDAKSGKWQLLFSFDPNRIPLQYALQGSAKNGKLAQCELKGISFPGAIYQFSLFPEKPGSYGLSLDKEKLQIFAKVAENNSELIIQGQGIEKTIPLQDAIRLQQWHQVSIERWANVLKVSIDGNTVFQDLALTASSSGPVSLVVNSGQAVFDDFSVREIIYLQNNQIPWQVTSKDSLWGSGKKMALIGFKGGISTPKFRLKINELLLDKSGKGQCQLNGKPFTETGNLIKNFSENLPQQITLDKQKGQKVQFKNIAIRFSESQPDIFRFGPYDFSSFHVEDISDYMDFTDEEIQAMNNSKDADVVKRKPRKRAVIGGLYNSVWGGASRRYWRLKNGVLQGATRRGRADKRGLTFWQELNGDYEISLKLKLADSKSAAQIVLYNNSEGGCPITIAGKDYPMKLSNKPNIKTDIIGKWLPIKIVTDKGKVHLKSEDMLMTASYKLNRKNGGGIKLLVPAGSVEFDDISITVSRKKPGYTFNAFDRREADWWREGNWVDHSGIACAFASNWTSLLAPDTSGMLLKKNPVSDDFLFGFNVGESSEWFGWKKKPQHVHYPWDNITIKLSPEQQKNQGYEIRINSENRTKTILLRNGKEVASVAQDRNFPIRYGGGHAPYSPRRCRVVLRRQGREILLYLNGRKVLSYKDPEPINAPALRIGGFNTRINFSNIELLEFKQ